MRALAAAAAGALACALLAGCSGKPPVIARVFGRVIYVHDTATGENSETLGVFLVATDPDGMEDLSAFYVINDDAELFWKVERGAWSTSTADAESWIGTSSLSMPGTQPLPPGTYRVILQSVGGDTAEETLTVPARPVPASQAAYPGARVDAGAILVTSPFANPEVWVYGKDGTFAGTFPAGPQPLTLQSVTAASPALTNGFTFRVFAWSEQAGYGVLSGPYASGPGG